MSTFRPSQEQKNILDGLLEADSGTIIRVSAVAGSGKTSTNLYLASQMPDSNFLLLTYNKHLADETVNKKQKLGLDNITVKTFHSFANTLLSTKIFDDDDLIEALKDIPDINKKALADYQVIIFDEFQDITEPLFRMIDLIPRNKVITMIYGDSLQCIYKYNGATDKYMTLINKIYANNKVVDYTLSKSFRVPESICSFINDSCYCAQVITGSSRPKYIKPWLYISPGNQTSAKFVVDRILDIISTHSMAAINDIFILCASAKVKAKPGKYTKESLPAIIANQLSDIGVMSFIDIDSGPSDPRCLKNKVIISSIHKAKGRERKYVFILGFDENYFNLYNKDFYKISSLESRVPNEMYVAMTRASEALFLISHRYSRDYKPDSGYLGLPSFVRTNNLLDYVSGNRENISSHLDCEHSWSNDRPDPIRRVSVTDLIASLPSVTKNRIKHECLEIIKVPLMNKGRPISLNQVSAQKTESGLEYHEAVSDITGIASVLRAIFISSLSFAEIDSFMIRTFKRTYDPQKNIDNVLELATEIQTIDRGYNFRRSQLGSSLEWITGEILDTLATRINRRLTLDRPEKVVEHEFPDHQTFISGRIDNITASEIHEIKTTGSITLEHYIQVAVYGLLDHLGSGSSKKLIVYNCRNDTMHEVIIKDFKKFESLILSKNVELSEDDFLQRIQIIRNH